MRTFRVFEDGKTYELYEDGKWKYVRDRVPFVWEKNEPPALLAGSGATLPKRSKRSSRGKVAK